jgi:hypothetical protein
MMMPEASPDVVKDEKRTVLPCDDPNDDVPKMM